MRVIYTILLYFLTPLVKFRLYWKARVVPDYGQRVSERFAYFDYSAANNTSSVWIHAVSLGEVIAAEPMVKALLATYPTKPIIFTTMTPTGSARVKQVFGKKVFHVYVPYDLPSVVQRFLTRVNPQVAIFLETEIWPNIYYYCHQRNIPVIIANARLSEKSAKGYHRFASLFRQTLANVTTLLAQSKEDAARFIALGAKPENVFIAGNIKFDLNIPEQLDTKSALLKQRWGELRPVFMAGSTHPGEDEKILAAFTHIRQQFPTALLLLIPRHTERAKSLISLSQSAGFNSCLRSHEDQFSSSMDVIVGDTMGEMMLFYCSADIAFVGGSLIEHGGQNVLEPAALAIPIVSGPHVANFAEICRVMKQQSAIIFVENEQELAESVIDLLKLPDKANRMALRAQAVVEKNRGTLERQLASIQQYISI